MAEIFLKNAWYCAGWDHMVHQGRTSIVARKIAGVRVVLYRKPDGGMVALEDRCPHRQAARSAWNVDPYSRPADASAA